MEKTKYLFVSDFDKTLSLDDGGFLLSELIGISREDFEKKVKSIANKSFVQQGAELSYLIEYDPDYKGKLKKEDFIKVGKKISLKNHIKEKIPYDRILYVGDGVSDINVMLHLRTLDGYPIAASKSDYLGHIAKRSVISDDALAFLIPVMEDILNFSIQEIRKFFLERNIIIQDWKRAKVDWITIV